MGNSKNVKKDKKCKIISTQFFKIIVQAREKCKERAPGCAVSHDKGYEIIDYVLGLHITLNSYERQKDLADYLTIGRVKSSIYSVKLTMGSNVILQVAVW